MATIGGPKLVTEDLIFALDAASKKSYPGSGTTWFDLISSNNGTLTGGPTFDSGNEGSIVFDGTNDYVNGPATNSVIGDNRATITLSAWVKITGTSAMYLFNCKRSDSFSTLVGLTANYNTSGGGSPGLLGALVRRVDNSTHTWYAYDGNYDNDGIWHNVVFTATGTANTLYIDGILRSTDNLGMQTVSGNTGPITVGSFGTSSWTNGNIACVKLYTRDLSADEVLQNYNALKNRFGL
jgi:hypothetical protein